MHLDDVLLEQYIREFYGYGNYKGDWWLLGDEEGGGKTLSDLTFRLQRWNEIGRVALGDVANFDSSPDHAKWFVPRPPLQSTWNKLIRLILIAEGKPIDKDTIRLYQGGRLGRKDSNNCILELLPLPARKIKDWIYADCSGLSDLSSRKVFTNKWAPIRAQYLRALVVKHRPKVVVSYSRHNREWWEIVAGAAFRPTELPGLDVVVGQDTIFVITLHPTSYGVTNDYFEKAGNIIADLQPSVRKGSVR